MKRWLSVVLALIFTVAFASTALAADREEQVRPEEPIIPAYIGTASISAGLQIDDGTAECYYSINLKSGYKASLTASLQQYTGDGWTTIKSWSEPKATYHSETKYWAVPSGHTYRVYAQANVYDSNGNYVEYVYVASPSDDS